MGLGADLDFGRWKKGLLFPAGADQEELRPQQAAAPQELEAEGAGQGQGSHGHR